VIQAFAIEEIRMKTQEEIQKEIEALKAVRPNIVPISLFGDDNLAALDAQIQVLEEGMDIDDIWDEWWDDEEDTYVREAAEEAVNWMEWWRDPDDGDLAESWPLKK
jgi:hypothetical protein